MASITLKNVVKTYENGVTVIPDLNLEIKDKEFIITVHTDKDITLEKGLLKERANFFEEVFFLKPVIMQQKGR